LLYCNRTDVKIFCKRNTDGFEKSLWPVLHVGDIAGIFQRQCDLAKQPGCGYVEGR